MNFQADPCPYFEDSFTGRQVFPQIYLDALSATLSLLHLFLFTICQHLPEPPVFELLLSLLTQTHSLQLTAFKPAHSMQQWRTTAKERVLHRRS